MSGIVWAEPPLGRHTRAFNYGAVADELRRRPKEWAIVRVMPNSGRSSVVASEINRGRIAALPAGDFEAMARNVDGEYRVYARYVGSA